MQIFYNILSQGSSVSSLRKTQFEAPLWRTAKLFMNTFSAGTNSNMSRRKRWKELMSQGQGLILAPRYAESSFASKHQQHGHGTILEIKKVVPHLNQYSITNLIISFILWGIYTHNAQYTLHNAEFVFKNNVWLCSECNTDLLVTLYCAV